MPFDKSWDKKVKIPIFPFRRNKARTCQNCWSAFHFKDFNCCTGLCKRCTNLNPVTIQMSKKTISTSTSDNLKCEKCDTGIKLTNFGICRRLCEHCRNENNIMRQRCLVCQEWGVHYWNYICGPCMHDDVFLCEKNGFSFPNQNYHFRKCWCLNHEEQKVRKELNVTPPSNIRESENFM